MHEIPDGSVDLILADLPYGTTACAWDSIIPFPPLWEQYERIIKYNGAIILTGSQPFSSALVMSNPKLFKYSLIWVKTRATGHVHAKNKPMKKHEDVLVFSPGTTVHKGQSDRRMTYNPQGLIKKKKPTIRKAGGAADTVMGARPSHKDVLQEYTNYPDSILEFAGDAKNIHPTQKPLALFEYLVLTYSNKGEMVVDNVMGSGTTGIACLNTGRNFFGIEHDEDHFENAKKRIDEHE